MKIILYTGAVGVLAALAFCPVGLFFILAILPERMVEPFLRVVTWAMNVTGMIEGD